MNFYLSFVLISCLNCFIESKEFCHSFRDNGNRFDYTFMYNKDIEGKEDMAFIDMIIGQQYWRLMTNRTHVDLKFVDPNYESRPTGPFFAGNHSIAFHTCCCQVKFPIGSHPWSVGCRAFLMNPNTWDVSIGLEGKTHPVSTLENFKKEKQRHLDYMTGKRMFAFAIDFHDLEYGKVVFIDYDRAQGKLNTIAIFTHDFYKNLLSHLFVRPFRLLDNYNQMKLLNMQIGKFNLLSIEPILLKPNYIWQFILFWEKDQQLRWCSNNHNFNLSNECFRGFLLIDCRIPAKPTKIPFITIKPSTVETTPSTEAITTTLSTLVSSTATPTTLSTDIDSQTPSTESPTLPSVTSMISTEKETKSTELQQIGDNSNRTFWLIFGIILFVVIIAVITLIVVFMLREKSTIYNTKDIDPGSYNTKSSTTNSSIVLKRSQKIF